MKRCSVCKHTKPLNEFYLGKNGLHCRCRECDKKKARVWRAANKEKANSSLRDWKKRNPAFYKRRRMKLYGITTSQYNTIFESQGGVCAICGDRKKLQIDHCHATKKVRGLLCSSCNLGIGHLRESPNILANALSYLQPSIRDL